MSNKISEIIRHERKIKKITLKQLSDNCGVSAGHLSEFENGKTVLGGEKLISICRYLGVDLVNTPESSPEDVFYADTKANTGEQVNELPQNFGRSLEDQLAYQEWQSLSPDQKLLAVQMLRKMKADH